MDEIKSRRLDKALGTMDTTKLAATRQHVNEELGREDPEIPIVIEEGEFSEDEKRLQRLDIITDVLLVLVEKYRRAAKLMWAAIILLLMCGAGLVTVGLIGLDIQERLVQLAREQQGILNEQKAAKKAAEEAKKQAAATQKEVEATKQKVDEAVEASPKIEIDDKGKAKVVVPIKKAEPKPKKGEKGEDLPPAPKPPPPPTAQLPQQLPIELR